MIETRDYWTIGTSIVALLVSCGALSTAIASYRLARARDRREGDSKKPLVRVTIPMLDGPGPWPVPVMVHNRDDVPITLQSFRCEEQCPVTLCSNNYFRSVGIESISAMGANPTWVDLAEEVQPDEKVSFEVSAGLYKGRIGANIPADFTLTYVRRDTAEQVQRLSIRRTVNPTYTSPSP